MQKSITNASGNINRRDFLKISAVAGLSLGLSVAFGRRWLEKDNLVKVTETHYLMGTIVNFSLFAIDEQQGKNAIKSTRMEMERLISIFDHRNAGTQLRKLNQVGFLHQPSLELVEIIQRALSISRLTNGAFDITVKPLVDAFLDGRKDNFSLVKAVDYKKVSVSEDELSFMQPDMSITLDGIAKGRVVDGGVAALRSFGFESVLVEAGGDLLASSDFSTNNTWTIGINNPRGKDTDCIATFSVDNGAVATSGDYVNYIDVDYSHNHIIDPRSGISPNELASVSVMASTAMDADALSTGLMVLGVQDGLALTEQLPDVESLFITKDQKIYRSVGFPVS